MFQLEHFVQAILYAGIVCINALKCYGLEELGSARGAGLEFGSRRRRVLITWTCGN